jgi:hypothetical protein
MMNCPLLPRQAHLTQPPLHQPGQIPQTTMMMPPTVPTNPPQVNSNQHHIQELPDEDTTAVDDETPFIVATYSHVCMEEDDEEVEKDFHPFHVEEEEEDEEMNKVSIQAFRVMMANDEDEEDDDDDWGEEVAQMPPVKTLTREEEAQALGIPESMLDSVKEYRFLKQYDENVEKRIREGTYGVWTEIKEVQDDDDWGDILTETPGAIKANKLKMLKDHATPSYDKLNRTPQYRLRIGPTDKSLWRR